MMSRALRDPCESSVVGNSSSMYIFVNNGQPTRGGHKQKQKTGYIHSGMRWL